MQKIFLKIFLGIFLLGIIAFGINILALSQIRISTSAESLSHTVNEFISQSTMRETDFNTELIIKNPTMFPVFIPEMEYELRYGEAKIADGKSNPKFIMPFSSMPVEFSGNINHSAALSSIIQAVNNFLDDKKENLLLNAHANFFGMKINIKILE